jgi:hypothetical protein
MSSSASAPHRQPCTALTKMTKTYSTGYLLIVRPRPHYFFFFINCLLVCLLSAVCCLLNLPTALQQP